MERLFINCLLEDMEIGRFLRLLAGVRRAEAIVKANPRARLVYTDVGEA